MMFQFDRTASRLAEMQTREYLDQPRVGRGGIAWSTFKALRAYSDENDRSPARVVGGGAGANCRPGEVVFKTAYSSVNYKDALAATGTGQDHPQLSRCIGGIDAAGTVVSSSRRALQGRATR